jgi:uncharacterized 2Fe-2S/4Fe-4S cluster protein (DUF4445 family)
MYTVTIHPQMTSWPVEQQQTLFDVLVKNGLVVDSPCGGKGTCGKCKVQIISGYIPDPSAEEYHHLSAQELAQNIRLSCQLFPTGDLSVNLLQEDEKENYQILSGGFLPEFNLHPHISKKVHQQQTRLSPHHRSCLDLLAETLDISEVLDQPIFLQSYKHIHGHEQFTAVYADDRLIGLEKGDSRDQTYGIAIDIGTTTVVISLADLNKGKEIDSATGLNPQKANGQDVLSRIEFTRKEDNGLNTLHQSIIGCLNTIIDRLCVANQVAKNNIYDITIAANTTMLHLLLCVDPTPIGKSPYVPVFTRYQSFPTAAFGLNVSPFARLYCLPGVSGYIGADIVAGVNVCQLNQTTNNVLFIDIGTNGEIVLSKGGTLYACACAAGPALEGMNISCGMMAGEGAVERVQITDDNIHLKVIGDSKPKGLCGSGVIEAISEMARVGLIQKTGRLKSKKDAEQDAKLEGLSRFIEEDNNKRKLVLDRVHNIVVTQADIRQVQLAKGAILSGIHALLHQLEMTPADLDEIIISGQFGRHLHVDSLVGLGVIPYELREKVTYIGNSSQTGALMCLLSTEKRREVEDIANKINHFELTMLKDYEKLFSKCLKFE